MHRWKEGGKEVRNERSGWWMPLFNVKRDVREGKWYDKRRIMVIEGEIVGKEMQEQIREQIFETNRD